MSMLKTLVLSLLVVGSAYAGSQELSMDRFHSNINFKVSHLMTKVTGNFNEFSGHIQLSKQGELESVFVEVDVASIDTAVVPRDEHLRSADFFEVETYPKAVFKSTEIISDGNTYKVYGEFTMKGVTKVIYFHVAYLGADKDQMDNLKQGFRAVAKIRRSDFNIDYNVLGTAGTLIIGDLVELEINAQFTK